MRQVSPVFSIFCPKRRQKLEKMRTSGLGPPKMTFVLTILFEKNPLCFSENPHNIFQKLFPALSDVEYFLVLFGSFFWPLRMATKTMLCRTLLRRPLLSFICHNSTRRERSKRNPCVVVTNKIHATLYWIILRY